jgi:hypothetical protein
MRLTHGDGANRTRAKIIAASISSSLRCHSVGCGTASRMTPSDTHSNCSRSHHAVIRVYDESGNVIQTQEHAGDFKEW